MDWVIGGEKMAGQGWRMLMECLAAGRAISLPSSAAAGAKSLLRVTSAYARIRKQFDLPIGKMEGLEEPLARMVETAYVNEAARAVTAAMVSRGEKPSVISAIMKYQTTERMRRAVNDAMDMHGGRAICDGPRNYLQSAYQMVPVGITVEGANILTRSLITFAQGALRSHPYLYKEIQAAQDPDARARARRVRSRLRRPRRILAVERVRRLLPQRHIRRCSARRRRRPTARPNGTASLRAPSRNFAFVADLTVALLGGGLKTKQKLTGRLADALSELYMLACVLKRYEDDGRPAGDRHIVDACREEWLLPLPGGDARHDRQLPCRAGRGLMRAVVFPLGRHYKPAPDCIGPQGRRSWCCEPGEVRDRLTRYIFVSKDPNDPTGLLEVTLEKGGRRRGGRKEARTRHPRRARAPLPRHRLDRRRGSQGRHHGEPRRSSCARSRALDRARHRGRPLRSGGAEAQLRDARP